MDPARVARVDLSGVSNAEAASALKSMAGAIEKELRRVSRVRLSGIDLEDLRAIAHLAILEALVTYAPSRGRKFSSWAYQVLRWRLLEAVRIANAAYEHEAHSPHLAELARYPEDGLTPEDVYLEHETRDRVERHLAELPPRAGLALAFKLRGESLAEIGASVGVHSSLVCREIQDAVKTVAQAVLEEEEL